MFGNIALKVIGFCVAFFLPTCMSSLENIDANQTSFLYNSPSTQIVMSLSNIVTSPNNSSIYLTTPKNNILIQSDSVGEVNNENSITNTAHKQVEYSKTGTDNGRVESVGYFGDDEYRDEPDTIIIYDNGVTPSIINGLQETESKSYEKSTKNVQLPNAHIQTQTDVPVDESTKIETHYDNKFPGNSAIEQENDKYISIDETSTTSSSYGRGTRHEHPRPDEVQVGCRELRSKRYISDGFCTSQRPIWEVVCTGHCLPHDSLPWYAEFIKVWAKTKVLEYRCVDDVVKHKRVELQCENGEFRSYKIKVVKSCKCKRFMHQENMSYHRRSKSDGRRSRKKKQQRRKKQRLREQMEQSDMMNEKDTSRRRQSRHIKQQWYKQLSNTNNDWENSLEIEE